MTATTKIKSICELVGLPGMPRAVPAWHAKSMSNAIYVLRKKGVAVAAGVHGSVTIWKPKNGPYQAEFCRYKARLSGGPFVSIASLRTWLRVWWPKMKEPTP